MTEKLNNQNNGVKAIARKTNPEWLRKAFEEFREVIRLDHELNRYHQTQALPDTEADAFPHLPRK